MATAINVQLHTTSPFYRALFALPECSSCFKKDRNEEMPVSDPLLYKTCIHILVIEANCKHFLRILPLIVRSSHVVKGSNK